MTSPPDATPDFLNSGPTPPTELEQLEAALRAGAITPELFATLRAKLGDAPAAAGAEATVSSAGDMKTSPAPPPASAATGSAELPPLISLFENAPAGLPKPTPPAPPPASAPAAPRPEPTAADFLPPAPPAPAGTATPDFLPTPPAPLAAPTPAAGRPVAPAAPPTVPRPPAPVVAPPAPPQPSAPVVAPAAPRRNGLTIALVLMGLLCLLAVAAYYYVDQRHPDEDLTAPDPTAAVVTAPVPPPAETPPVADATPEATPPEPEPAPAPSPTETAATPLPDRPDTPPEVPAAAEEATPPAAAPAAGSPATTPAAPVPGSTAPFPAAPEAGDDAATIAVRTVLARYYADLFSPPLRAENYFAPQVERFYIQRDLTPAQINATINQTFFSDNQQAVYQVEPGTLRVSAAVKDGSRTATYVEKARIFRVSLGRYQRLRTQVRVRFDKENRITYMRQEKLLLNTFE